MPSIHAACAPRASIFVAAVVRPTIGPSHPHIVYVSIVGVDKTASWSYSKAKLASEHLVIESGLPWTILRATQFYDYI